MAVIRQRRDHQLRPRNRRVLALSIEGRSLTEIAAELGTTVAVVRVRRNETIRVLEVDPDLVAIAIETYVPGGALALWAAQHPTDGTAALEGTLHLDPERPFVQ